MNNLEGKVAVVLGCSAERGTGWAIAERLAKEGAKVVVSARRIEPLEKLAGRIKGKAVVCDAGDPAQISALAAEAVKAFGKIDIAVNAAGHPVTGLIAEMGPEKFAEAINVNYLGNAQFIREMAANMNDGGSIVLISSISADQVVPLYAAYGAAKAATDCLVKYAGYEYGPRGIRVNSVQPGAIKTDMGAFLFDYPTVEALFASKVPMRRIGQPSDYADVVVWLAGPAYITGTSLPVSGGAQLVTVPSEKEVGETFAAAQEAGRSMRFEKV